MKIETPLIAMILAGVVFSAMFTFVFTIADANDKSYSMSDFTTEEGVELEDAFDKVNSTKTEIEEVTGDFEDSSLLDSALGVFPFLKLIYSTGKQIAGSLNIFKDMMSVTSEIIGIPPFFTAAIVSIVIIVTIISILMILAGRTY